MDERSQPLDVCVVCALAEEAGALLDAVSEQCQTTFITRTSPRYGYDYQAATIQNNRGEPLALHVSWLPRMGPQETTLHLSHVLEEYQPRFVAMTGICAGDRLRVSLGDLVVAERLYTYDSGKFVTDEQGRTVHEHDVLTYQLDENILRFLPLFQLWRQMVAQLRRPPSKRQQREWLLSRLLHGQTPTVQQISPQELERQAPDWRRIVHELQQGPAPLLTSTMALRESSSIEQLRYGLDAFPYLDPPEARSHIKPMASGSAVRGDTPFNDIQVPVRGTVAVDMEGAAFGRVMASAPGLRWLVVKGVSDYADSDKDDSYHQYASTASALYLLCFLREYITDERLPRAGVPSSPTQAGREDPPVSQAQQPVQSQRRLAHSDPFPPVWNVPYRYAAYFTGRDQVLDQLFQSFTSMHQSGMLAAQALTGLGGLGKTQTAVAYAYRYRKHYQTVLWVRAETEESLLAHFKSAAKLLERPEAHLKQRESLLASMQEWFRNTTGWLLIFDNADNLALVEPFLPRSASGHLLLTSREVAMGPVAQPLALMPLAPDDGALCMLRRANAIPWSGQLSAASPGSVKAAQELSQLMNGLPLALEQAGAYIETTGRSVSGYLDLYRRYRPEIQRYQHGAVPNYHEPVAFAWNIAREAVRRENAAAIELLHLCAFLAPEDISYELLTANAGALGPILGPVAANEVALDRAIALLRKHSLMKNEVDRDTDISSLTIHPVLQEILKDDMDSRTQRLWAERAVRLVAHVPSQMDGPIVQAHVRQCLLLIDHWKMNFREAQIIRQSLAAERM